MTLSLTEIDAVVAELAEALAGATLLGADPLPGPAILIRFDAGGQTRRVLVSAQPHASRINLTTHRFDPNLGEQASAQDRAFADRVYRELRGAKVASIKRVLGDRVVAIDFETHEHNRSLTFECSGQHPNLFLCDDHRVILMMLASTKSQRRDLRPGSKYARPLKHDRDTVETLRFVEQGGSVSKRIEEFYEGEETRSENAKATGGIRAALKTALQRQERLIEAINGDLAKARDAAQAVVEDQAPVVAAAGEGDAAVAVVEGATPVVAQPVAKPVARGSVLWQERRLIQARAAAEHLGNLLAGMLDGDPKGLDAARRYVEEIMAPPVAERRGDRPVGQTIAPRNERPVERPVERPGERADVRQPAPAVPAGGTPLPQGVRRFRAQDGTPIWVATNPVTAPQLTFQAAQEDDFWLRVDGASGAHVIVACGNHEPAFATLVDAALLAVHFSRVDALNEQPVQVARRRELSPVRETAPDQVRVKRSRVFTIRPDAKRVAVLLGTEGRGALVPGGSGRTFPGRPGEERPPAGGPRGPRPAFGGTGRGGPSRNVDRPRRDGPAAPAYDSPRRDGPAAPAYDSPRRDGPGAPAYDSPRNDGPARPEDRGPRPGYGAPRAARPPRAAGAGAPPRREPARPAAPARRRYPVGVNGPAKK
jgi:hypothetical protein